MSMCINCRRFISERHLLPIPMTVRLVQKLPIKPARVSELHNPQDPEEREGNSLTGMDSDVYLPWDA
jgi:hypothetical protein